MSAQVKLASPVYPVYPVRRADRGPAPITRLIHLPPPAVPLPDPGPRSYTILIAHHVNLLSRLGRSRPPGTTARLRAGLGAGPIIAPGRRSAPAANSAGSGAGRTTRVPTAYPLTDTERPLSCQIQAGSPMHDARDQRQRETPPSAPCRQIETPAPARTGVIIAALCRLSKIRSLSSGGIMPDHACDRGAARLDLGASRSQAYQPNEDYPWWVRFLAWLGDGCRPGFPPAG